MRVLADGDLKELILTGYNRRYQGVARNKELMKGLRRAIYIMESVETPEGLGRFSYLHYEKLRYEMSGFSSVRLSNSSVHRLIFKEYDDRITLQLIEIDDTHYGNKK